MSRQLFLFLLQVGLAICLQLLLLTQDSVNASSNIPYDLLAAKLSGQLLKNSETNLQLASLYNQSIYIDNGSYQIRPHVLVLPLTISDVQETVKFAQKYQLEFSVKCGGHSAVGYSLNHELVLDMRYFNKTRVIDTVNGIAYIEAGLQWNVIYPSLAPWIPIAGTCPKVGVSGYTLGGGYSMLSRSYGLGSDQVIEFDMVLPNGDFVRVNNESYTDLYWALRGGGGGNFGVLTAIKTRVYQSKPIMTSQICWTFEQSIQVLEFYNQWTMKIPKEMTVYGLFFQVPQTLQDQFCLTFVYNGDFTEGTKIMEPFFGMNNGVLSFHKKQTFPEFIKGFSSGTTDIKNRFGIVKSGLVNLGNLKSDFVRTIYNHVKNRPSKHSMIIFSHVGGRVREIPLDSTSFYRRNAEFTFEFKAIFDRKEEYETNSKWIEEMYSKIKYNFDGAYLNYIDDKLPNWKDEYYGSFYSRLLQIKNKYDRNNLFKFKQSIGSSYDIATNNNNNNREGAKQSIMIPVVDNTNPNNKQSVKSTRDEEIVKRVHLFQKGQVDRDIPLLDSLFAINSQVNIPIGSTNIKGKNEIIQNFALFFNTLVNITEDITSKIEVNGLYAGFSKNISQFTKKGCLVKYSVINWFQFDNDENLLITDFSALFNLTHVIEQANCKK